MRKHRFYYDNHLNLQQDVTLAADLSHQVSRVLRLQPQDQIYLFNNYAMLQYIQSNPPD